MHAKVHKIPTDPPFMDTGAQVTQWVRSLDLTTHKSLSPIRRGFAPGFVNYKKGCTRLTILRQKMLFFPIGEGGAKIVEVFRVKNHDFWYIHEHTS